MFAFKHKETNALTKDGKFIIPLKQYRILWFIFFSRNYSKWYKNWRLSFKNGVKKYPLETKIHYNYSDLIKKYKSKWCIPTNKDWIINYDR